MTDDILHADPSNLWAWFAKNEPRFRALGADAEEPVPAELEPLLDELFEQLQACSEGVYFAVGGIPGGTRELILTAEGEPRYFDAVRAIAAAAPSLPGWEVIAFKPAMGFDFECQWDEAHVDPSECWVLPRASSTDPTHFVIRFATPTYTAAHHSDFESAALEVLNTGLGELVAANEIEAIEVGPVPATPEADGYMPLVELAEFLDARRTSAPN